MSEIQLDVCESVTSNRRLQMPNPEVVLMGELQYNSEGTGRGKKMRSMLEEGELPTHQCHCESTRSVCRAQAESRKEPWAERLCQE